VIVLACRHLLINCTLDSQTSGHKVVAEDEIRLVNVLGGGFGVLSDHSFNYPLPWAVEHFQETSFD
jgi:hypothetical protein